MFDNKPHPQIDQAFAARRLRTFALRPRPSGGLSTVLIPQYELPGGLQVVAFYSIPNCTVLSVDFQMAITSAVASPPPLICSRRHSHSFPSLISRIGKDAVRSYRAPELHTKCKSSLQPVAIESESSRKVAVHLSPVDNDNVSTSSAVAKTSSKNKNTKKTQTEVAHKLLSIIKYPLNTEAAMKAILERNTLVFVVDKRANKPEIKDVVEKMFQIRAKKVNTLINYDGTKKAFVMLAPDCNAVDVAKRINLL
ncbi:60S ribosomal protein L23a-1 [Striga hermonthica]|uniref:60S ribosomal protein L23a-1 n=1 Tax=Striga hermonthica TaxID=68872 RepID=A0A9N7NNI0_STRHE|nr:60S ribosomal protein L23a-1 [Striga hermonthica]